MATDYISRREFDRTMQERYCFNCERKGNHPIFGVACKACWVMDMLDEVEQFQSADVVEVVRCKDCIYWRDSYVEENDGTERQCRDDDVDLFGMRGVTIDIGINVGSMCLLEENKCGWKPNKNIFRNENDFCSRGERRPCSYEEWWGIVDGVYPKVVEIDQVKEEEQ